MQTEVKTIRQWLEDRGYNPNFTLGYSLSRAKDETLHDLLWAFFCSLQDEGYVRRNND